jgi:hypothetical protein
MLSTLNWFLRRWPSFNSWLVEVRHTP